VSAFTPSETRTVPSPQYCALVTIFSSVLTSSITHSCRIIEGISCLCMLAGDGEALKTDRADVVIQRYASFCILIAAETKVVKVRETKIMVRRRSEEG